MIQLLPAPFDPAAEIARFTAECAIGDEARAGAIVSFLGLARGVAADAPALELEAYPGFTEAQIRVFMDEASARFGLQRAAVFHRIGWIRAGEPIVLVLTAAAHRREAFEACDLLMDYLKSRAPLWKREFGPGGARWIEPTDRDRSDLQRWT